jgi:hypothetical protein
MKKHVRKKPVKVVKREKIQRRNSELISKIQYSKRLNTEKYLV